MGILSTTTVAKIAARYPRTVARLTASVVGWVLVTALVLQVRTPLGVVAVALRGLGVTTEPWLPAITAWCSTRTNLLTAVAVIGMVTGLGWSFAWLRKFPERFEDVRGPVTYPFALAVLAEAHGYPWSVWALTATMGILILVSAASWVFVTHHATVAGLPYPSAEAAGSLALGIMLVQGFLFVAICSVLGGLRQHDPEQQSKLLEQLVE